MGLLALVEDEVANDEDAGNGKHERDAQRNRKNFAERQGGRRFNSGFHDFLSSTSGVFVFFFVANINTNFALIFVLILFFDLFSGSWQTWCHHR